MIALVFAAALFATDASAATPQVQTGADPVKVSDSKARRDPNRMVCRSEDRPGSRMASRECHTQAEWEARDQQMRDFFRNVQDRTGLQGPDSPPALP